MFADGPKFEGAGEYPVSTKPPLTKKQYAFGYERLGPVVAHYLSQLACVATSFEQDLNARILFVSRAGIRIRQCLEQYLESAGIEGPSTSEYFWVSRLMAAKGIWNKDRARAIATISKEFVAESVTESLAFLVAAMFRNERLPDDIDLTSRELRRSGAELAEFLEAGGVIAKKLENYFAEQSAMFEDYVDQLLGGQTRVLLVDTGWQGTTQRLLSGWRGDVDWWGAYFGRYSLADTDRRCWSKMIGLVFEQDQISVSKPETCVILNRHLIEDLFEPEGPSIERLRRGADGTVEAPEAERVLAHRRDSHNDPHFSGVMDYLARLPDGCSPSVLARKARQSWYEIARVITLPSRKDTELFRGIERSADFGKSLLVPMVWPPSPRYAGDTPACRIADSLWQSGQIAVEYPQEIARPLQRKLAGLSRADFTDKALPVYEPAAIALSGEAPFIAVITRTLDRPMFLRRALESVAQQTFTDYRHVIVCDGGDIEETKAIIQSFPCDQRKVVLVDNVVNRGMEAASNIGIESTDSEFIVIHDDDDCWDPYFLEKTAGFLRSAKGKAYGGVVTKSIYVSEEITPGGILIHDKWPYRSWIENVHLMEMALGNFFPPIAFVFRRKIWKKIGGFDERLPVLGDWDFNLRFLLEADIGVIPEYLAHYHHRDRGDTNLFGNTVIAERDKHLEFSAVVRNKFARNALHSNHPAVAMLVGIGLHFRQVQNTLRQIHSHIREDRVRLDELLTHEGQPAEGESSLGTDDYWVALHRMVVAIAEKDRAILSRIKAKVKRRPFLLWRQRTGHATEVSRLCEILNDLRHVERSIPCRITPSPDFDEDAYLGQNPEVADAVRSGALQSGYEHYLKYGRYEGRRRPRVSKNQ